MINFIVHNENITGELECLMKDNMELLREAQKGDACFADNLGWLDTEEWANESIISRLEEIAAQIRENADVFVLIGVGGSNNAARAVIEALKQEGPPEIVYAGNTLSPNLLNKVSEKLKGKSVYIDCIAKNFEILEPGLSFRILRKFMYQAYGAQASERIITTGTKGSLLERLSKDNGYTYLDFPADIGGRYTAVSSVGLLPMAVAGMNIRKLVKGAHDMQNYVRTQEAMENPAFRYACIRNLYYRSGYKIEMLSGFEPQFRFFYKWWIQLFAESEGKNNKGMFPAASEFSEDLHSVGQFIQEGSPILFETFLKVLKPQDSLSIEPDFLPDDFGYLDNKDVKDINEIAYQATVEAHGKRLPCQTIELDALDEYHFGQLFYFFQFACYLSCRLLEVNPFDQPGVEAYKKRMFAALGKNNKQD